MIFKHLPSLFITLAFSFFILFSTSTFAAVTSTTNLPITGFANDPGMPAFERQFISFLKKWRAPGASITVVKNGQIMVARGYGWADKETNQPISPDSLFRIASVSKTFTATAVLKLIQEGKLRLDDFAFDILNDLRPLNGRLPNPKIYQITVQDLLQMSSGWFVGGSGHFDPMFGPWPKKITDILSPELPASCETTTRFMMSQPLRYKPGTTYAYSNLDYCILGLIINKITGSRYGYKGYEQYLKNAILVPLDIHTMQIGSTQAKYRAPNEVTYYRGPGAISALELANSYYLPYSDTELLKKNFANGGWLATSKDLGKFIYALSQGQILNQKILNLMQQKPAFVTKKRTSYYTMGGIVYNLNGQRYWLQSGSFTGTNAFIITKPNGTTVAVVFNYRPDTHSLFARFRPELKRLIINSDL